jgi:PTH1 family peptidyl-tRNA hydrolase
MKLIIGLGNPGEKYKNTRHNVGYMVIDKLTSRLKIKLLENKKLSSSLIQSLCHGDKFILAKPNKFMNESGASVRKISDYYKIKINNICIISDDVDLPIGSIRVREEGSSGGHKGVESIIKSLNSEKFTRIRIGIAQLNTMPADADKMNIIDTKEFVLENFNNTESKIINKTIINATDIILDYLNGTKLESHTYEV